MNIHPDRRTCLERDARQLGLRGSAVSIYVTMNHVKDEYERDVEDLVSPESQDRCYSYIKNMQAQIDRFVAENARPAPVTVLHRQPAA